MSKDALLLLTVALLLQLAVVGLAEPPPPSTESTFMNDLPAGIPLNFLVAGAIDASVTGFVWDQENYPDLNPPEIWGRAWFSWQMYEYHQGGEVPPWHPVYCGITLQDYSGDLQVARWAANSVGYTYTSTQTAVEICNGLRAHVGSPWGDP